MNKENAITDLYIWIHPGHNPTPHHTIEKWKENIHLISQDPNSALIETSNAKNNSPYSLIVNKFQGNFKRHLFSIRQLEEYAEEKLDKRFIFWHQGNFIDGNNDLHKQILKNKLKTISFQKISCFGLQPYACVQWQANNSGLSTFSDLVIPCGIHL